MALSKSVNYFVNTIYYDPIAIGALNTNDSEAIQSTEYLYNRNRVPSYIPHK